MRSIMRSRLAQTYRKLILPSVITAITDSSISLGRSRNSSWPNKVFRMILMSPLRLPLSNGGLGIGKKQLRGCVAPLSLHLVMSMPTSSLRPTYEALRRFPEALATADRVLAWDPADTFALGFKATVFWATGDLQAVEPLLASPGISPRVRGMHALLQRRYTEAIQIFSGAIAADSRGRPGRI